MRFVAHFDMLGMGALVKRDFDRAWDLLCDLSVERQYSFGLNIKKKTSGEIIANQVRQYTFSDSIVAHTSRDTENDLLAIAILGTELFCQCLAHCIPVRAGIAHGDFREMPSQNLFAGPALVEAYELGESAQWLGITLSREVARRCAALPLCSGEHALVAPWDVPLKGGATERRQVLSWPLSHRANFANGVPYTAERFYSGFAKLFGDWESLDAGARAKYENTVAFVNAQLAPA